MVSFFILSNEISLSVRFPRRLIENMRVQKLNSLNTQTKKMNELVRLVKNFVEPFLSTLAPNVLKGGKHKNNTI